MTTFTIRATDLGEFIRYKSCERRFKLAYKNRELAKQLPFAGKLFATLDPVLKEAGLKRELEWQHYLEKLKFIELANYDNRPSESKSLSWDDLQVQLTKLERGVNAFIREVNVSADIDEFHVTGNIDFVLLHWRKGRPRVRLVECKASRRDQTYHRAQLVIYKIIVQQLLSAESTKLKVGEYDLQAEDLGMRGGTN